jgi:hypothetical protein
VSIAMGLVHSGQPLEVQHFGYQLLQALVRLTSIPTSMTCACRQRPCHSPWLMEALSALPR